MKKKIILLNIFFILLLASCKKEEPVEALFVASYHQNPSLQELEIELGSRFTRSLENTTVQNGFYTEDTIDINKLIPEDTGIDLLKISNYSKLEDLYLYDKITPLPLQVVTEMERVYPKALLSLTRFKGEHRVVPSELSISSLYINTDMAKKLDFDLTNYSNLLEVLDNKELHNISMFYAESKIDYLQLFDLLNLELNGLNTCRKLNNGEVLYNSEEIIMVLEKLKDLFQNQSLSSNESLFYYLTDTQLAGLDFNIERKLERVNSIHVKNLFGHLKGYVITGSSDNILLTNYLLHLISSSTEDYLFRVRGRMPIRKDFDTNKMITDQSLRHKSIQDAENIIPHSYQNYPSDVVINISNLLYSVLTEENSIEQYVKSIDHLNSDI